MDFTSSTYSDGLAQILLLYYYNTSNTSKIIMIIVSVLCFVSSVILIILNLIKNKNIKLKKILVSAAVVGLLIAPTVCSFTPMFYNVWNFSICRTRTNI